MGQQPPLLTLADDFFPLPTVDLGYWSSTLPNPNGAGVLP
jgi:hypothetical protein